MYALVDPRDGRRRYIGQSVQSLGVRLCGHRKNPSPRVGRWLGELQDEGMLPRIEVVRDGVPYAELGSAEREEIALALLRGEELLNVKKATGVARSQGTASGTGARRDR
ncbi:hypothetical protein CTZ27_30925 [Streptomyces griseocarneus]|nr:hypothetical protein CTZ27_30925 [Streptomyces griseocarneus]